MNWKKIRQDLLLATGSHLTQKLVGYVILMVLARHLPKEVMGQFFLAGTMATLLALATEWGVNRHLIRRTAHEPQRATEWLSQVLALRLPLMIGGYAFMAVAVAFWRPAFLVPVLLTCLYTLILDCYYSFGAMLLGLKRVGMHVACMIVGQLLTVALVVAAVQLDAGLNAVLSCYVIANVVMIALTLTLVRWKVGPVRLRWRLGELRTMVWQSLPFFMLTVLGIVHFKVDELMLGSMLGKRGDEAVATYAAAYKFLEVSQFIVRPAAMVFFPLCCELAGRGDWLAFERVIRKLLVTVGAMGLGAAVVIGAAAGLLVTLVFTENYGESIAVLRILNLSVPAVYLAFTASFLVNAMHLERRAVWATAACLAANVALNAYAIPRYGPQGAAWTTLATETVLAVVLLAMIAARLAQLKRGDARRDDTILTGGQEIVNHDAAL